MPIRATKMPREEQKNSTYREPLFSRTCSAGEQVHIRGAAPSGAQSALQAARDGISLRLMKKGFIVLAGIILALHVSTGCGVAHASLAVEAPCCGNNCPIGSAIGESACCHAQHSGAAAQEISRPVFLVAPPVVGLIPVSVILPVQTTIAQASLFRGSPSGAFQLALLCSRQI
jgi:hypothetical protein